jgi:hypothetical protein
MKKPAAGAGAGYRMLAVMVLCADNPPDASYLTDLRPAKFRQIETDTCQSQELEMARRRIRRGSNYF